MTPFAPAEFEIAGQKYQARKLQVFDQMAIAKRMMPVMKHLLTPEIMLAVAAARADGEKLELAKLDIGKFLPAMADAIYSLSDDDSERIIRTALKVVQRQGPGGVWTGVLTPQGDSMFDDIDLPTMLQIAWKVIEAQLGGFFSIAR